MCGLPYFSECFSSITSFCSSLKAGRVTPIFIAVETGVSGGRMTCSRSYDSLVAARFLTCMPRAFPPPRALGRTCPLVLSVVVRLISRHFYSSFSCEVSEVMAMSEAADGDRPLEPLAVGGMRRGVLAKMLVPRREGGGRGWVCRELSEPCPGRRATNKVMVLGYRDCLWGP